MIFSLSNLFCIWSQSVFLVINLNSVNQKKKNKKKWNANCQFIRYDFCSILTDYWYTIYIYSIFFSFFDFFLKFTIPRIQYSNKHKIYPFADDYTDYLKLRLSIFTIFDIYYIFFLHFSIYLLFIFFHNVKRHREKNVYFIIFQMINVLNFDIFMNAFANKIKTINVMISIYNNIVCGCVFVFVLNLLLPSQCYFHFFKIYFNNGIKESVNVALNSKIITLK